jgi:hypothetical protein
MNTAYNCIPAFSGHLTLWRNLVSSILSYTFKRDPKYNSMHAPKH